MDKNTFEALKRLLAYTENTFNDQALPQVIVEAASEVQRWMDEVEKDIE